MEHTQSPRRIALVMAAASAVLLATACSSDSSDEPDAVNLEPVTRVDSPDTAVPPIGVVTDSPSGLHSTTFDADTRSVVALSDDLMSLVVFTAPDGQIADQPPREISLPGAAAGIADAGDGRLLLPMDRSLVEVDLRTSDIDSIPIDANLTSAARLDDGRFAAGDDGGTIHVVDPDGDRSQVETVGGLTSVDALASTQYGVTALDRHQTSLTEVKVDDGSLGLALRAGEGAAHLDTDRFGRILVTDTVGRELLVYSSEDLLLRQRFPVDAQPWAVAYDDKSDVVWISLPGDNEVVGYTLDTGIPVEVARFPTVRQPDSIAVDSDTGDLFVGSATGNGLQRISVAEGR
ncbi:MULTISPECIES: hypothetical protein [Rhodococcus]|uniref:Lipoprotein n=1 Tax=Rhodococcoides kyotonense TaxID=398843 RepID=A0A177YFA2_9NOCA|nr:MULTISPECIES: hypothetical protein [Rhodococcus]NIL78769.1 hypothetical protein [Rhodococcus sp. B10]OAK54236.1 hypothetical protein A3K89_02090 [Rhodococcus kyotonensis]